MRIPSHIRSRSRNPPSTRARRLCSDLTPYNLQGIEVYNGAPIAYSLGNFVFGGNWNPPDKRTVLLELKLNKTEVTSTTVIPAYTDSFPKEPFQPYLVHGSGAAIFKTYVAQLSAAFPETLASLRRGGH
jgi:hypothetical protein